MTEMIRGRLYINGKLSAEDWAFVEKHIAAIVNLRTKPDVPPFNFSHRFMIWTPVTIQKEPDIRWVDTLMAQVNHLFDGGYPILIHDTIGVQRLGFVIAAFYMYRFRLSSKDALASVRQKKGDLEPTPNYLKLLDDYQLHLGIRDQRLRARKDFHFPINIV
ncbi:dual specificity protein phosphatase family protein [Rossellomorea aquimaris]|uniref:dual specificity protein phosphatase family protein n=1 Tax=Rossellomorea aquimaris TaxID=189382 RepID=UPI001F309163|nr:dual specificity protein phosphatase family protein [Rossellomorea aquimaris]